jgi:general secretion pathway protein B
VSFILDALRKSENERRRDTAPSLSQIPTAMPTPGLPSWIWLVIGALCLCILVLAGAWWQSARTRDAAPSAVQTDGRPAASERLAVAPEPLPAGNVRQATPEDIAAARSESSAGVPVDSRLLPTVAEIRSAGIALPALDLQLLSYNEDAAQRFVFINGFQYRQGQRVQNGPLIVTIYPEGVVLRQEGRDFVLLPE